jgi:trimethylamine--corrinoid protein Co-methyltransferase
MDYGQLVIDNELAGLTKFTLQGIPVNDETLAVDVIHEIGQSRNFLSHPHTMKHMRTAQSHPKLIDRRIRADWQADGGKTMYERAWEEALEILATHKPEPLPEGVQKTIRSIIKEAEAELRASKNK